MVRWRDGNVQDSGRLLYTYYQLQIFLLLSEDLPSLFLHSSLILKNQPLYVRDLYSILEMLRLYFYSLSRKYSPWCSFRKLPQPHSPGTMLFMEIFTNISVSQETRLKRGLSFLFRLFSVLYPRFSYILACFSPKFMYPNLLSQFSVIVGRQHSGVEQPLV